jgi:hypothetical protein
MHLSAGFLSPPCPRSYSRCGKWPPA